MFMKERFLDAVVSGELGRVDDCGVLVELGMFKRFFSDVSTDYVNSFLPAATIEKGRTAMSHTKYLFRVRKGVYRVHPEVIRQHINNLVIGSKLRSEIRDSTT